MSADGADTTRARSATTDGEDVKVVLEQTLLTCPEVFVYRIPPMMTSGGHRAEDWNLAKPPTRTIDRLRRFPSLLVKRRFPSMQLLFALAKCQALVMNNTTLTLLVVG